MLYGSLVKWRNYLKRRHGLTMVCVCMYLPMIIINNLLLRAAYLFFSDFKLLLKSGNLACIQESYFSPFPQSNQFTLNAWSNQDFKVSKRKVEWFLENMSSYGKFWLHKTKALQNCKKRKFGTKFAVFQKSWKTFS